MPNSDRLIVKIIKEICEEQNYSLSLYSYDWIMRIRRAGCDKNMFIYGYQFPQNDLAAGEICGDKAALYYVLADSGIPAAEHNFFMSPSNMHYIGEGGNWDRLCGLLDKHKKLVCKRNSGSGGGGVFIVRDKLELEKVTGEIFRSSRSMSVSPYYDIEDEFRVIVLCGEARVVYRKIRPFVLGNGRDSVAALAFIKFGAGFAEMDLDVNLARVPAENETVCLNWKHNLGRGASSEEIEDSPLKIKLTELSLKAAKYLDLNFVSVDIINANGHFMILEINSGIMMEKFAAASPENYKKAKELYSDAISKELF